MQHQSDRVESVGIGDSINDAPLPAMVDHSILVQKPDGSYDPDIHVSGTINAQGIDPADWNDAILNFLARHTSSV